VAEDPFTYEGPWAGYEGEKMHIYQDPAVSLFALLSFVL